jgi:hypothetical protein
MEATMKDPKDCTIAELKVRLNKGQSLLTEPSKQVFQLTFGAHMQEVGRSKMIKADYLAAFEMLSSCYRAQQLKGVEQKAERTFDYNTATFVERARYRAAQIRKSMAAAKEEAIRTGKAVKVVLSNGDIK